MATKTFLTRVLRLLAVVVAPLLLSSCWLTSIVTWADGQNLLRNGSFEEGTEPGGPFIPDTHGVMSVPTPPTDGTVIIPGWIVTGVPGSTDVAWIQNANSYVRDATTDGSHFLDLTGVFNHQVSNGTGVFGGVKQVNIPTVVGFNYHVSFAIGVFNPTYKGPITVVATLSGPNGENSFETSCGPYDPSEPKAQWKQCESAGTVFNPCLAETETSCFKAVSTTSRLTIYGKGQKAQDATQYIGLDSVLVDCVAPLGLHGLCIN